MRAGMVLLGLTLGVLWIVGLSYGATTWLVWFTFAAAIASLASVLVPEEVPWAMRVAPFAISGRCWRCGSSRWPWRPPSG